MPTILLITEWRFFFFSNEGNEPIHIHVEKGDKECKYWLKVDDFDIEEVISYNLAPTDRRELAFIVFSLFRLLITS